VSAFHGFPDGQVRTTAIPGSFFSDLLPAIDHLGELKVTLYALWSLGNSEAEYPYLTRRQLLADRLLMEGLDRSPSGAEQALEEALERSVARGSLLKARVSLEAEPLELYFLNSARGRAALAALERGIWSPSGEATAPVELQVERPNVFTLYEANIGPLTPLIAERLRDAEITYSEAWIEEAIRIAVENNVRKWRYVEAILEDWLTSGKRERGDRGNTEKARRRYSQGEFADFWDS
jgi:DnaD/phage-associated family protein